MGVLLVEPRTTLPLLPMPLRRTSLHWEDSLTTERSTRTSCSSREVLLEPRRDQLCSVSQSSQPPSLGRPRSSTSSSSTPPPRLVTDVSRPSKRRPRSSESSRRTRLTKVVHLKDLHLLNDHLPRKVHQQCRSQLA